MNKQRFTKVLGGVSIALLLAITLSIVACAPAPTPTPTPAPAPAPKPVAQKIVLKAVVAWATNNTVAKDYTTFFVDPVNKAAQASFPGEFEINLAGGLEVIPTNDQAEAIRKGVIDVNFNSSAYYVGAVPEAQVQKLTQLFPWEERKSGAYDVLNQLHQEKLNSYYLARLGRGLSFVFWSNVKVEKLADMKGLNIRVSAMHSDFVKELGAIPANITPQDTYNALQQGVVQGYYWTTPDIKDSSWNEVTKYCIGPGIYEGQMSILINMQAWNKLPDKLKNLMIQVAQDAEHKVVEENQKRMNEAIPLYKKQGIQWIDFSPADTKAYIDLAYGKAGWEAIAARAKDSPYVAKLRPLLTK